MTNQETAAFRQALITEMRTVAEAMNQSTQVIQEALFSSSIEIETLQIDLAILKHVGKLQHKACQAAYRLMDSRRQMGQVDPEMESVDLQLRVAIREGRRAGL